MPYYEIDPEMLEEMAEYGADVHSETSYYEDAEARIDFATASPFVSVVRQALIDAGLTSVRCRYDGGFDEGFAYFEFAQGADGPYSAEELAERLKDGALALASGVSIEHGPYPQEVKKQSIERLREIPPEKRAAQALEEFADELAVVLLGQGYGTGEFTMRGRFQADLQSGEITDLEDEE